MPFPSRPRPRRRAAVLCLLPLAALLLAGGCGREAPFYAPGSLTVTSTPDGAAILLDERDTGETTPHTFAPLDAGLYQVSVALDGWVPTPAGETVDLGPLDERTVAFTLSQTGLTITSTPVGARILIDGVDTGLVTPATVGGLEPGVVEVALALDGYVALPAVVEATVVGGQVVALPDDAFTLRPRRTVLVEGFSAVNCVNCPDLTANLVALDEDPDLAGGRYVFIEFSSGLWGADPFYADNPTENDDRFTYYDWLSYAVLPWATVDGAPLARAADADELRAAVDAGLAGDPGFLVDVAVDASAPTVQATVTLTPLRDVDLSGTEIYVALYENGLTIEPAPGVNGQTEFHHVFRDRADTLPQPGALVAGEPASFTVALQRGDRGADQVSVIAFVQDTATRAVLQAGLAPGAATAASEGPRP